MSETTPSLDKWDDFAGEFLKCDLITKFPVELVVINVTSELKDFKSNLYIDTEYNGRKWKVQLNRTNQNFVRSKGITSPKALIGKKLTFEKIKTHNPTTKSPTDSLLIIDIA